MRDKGNRNGMCCVTTQKSFSYFTWRRLSDQTVYEPHRRENSPKRDSGRSLSSPDKAMQIIQSSPISLCTRPRELKKRKKKRKRKGKYTRVICLYYLPIQPWAKRAMRTRSRSTEEADVVQRWSVTWFNSESSENSPNTSWSHVALRFMDTWTTQGGNCDGKNKKNKRQHSTSYFSGTGKRHGLVVVSGMALGGNSEERGNTEGRLVLISISQTLHRNTFNSGRWSQTPRVLLRQIHRQQMFGRLVKNTKRGDSPLAR